MTTSINDFAREHISSSTIANYQVKGGMSLHGYITDDLAKKCRLAEGVTVSVRPIPGVKVGSGNAKVTGVTIVASKKGVTLVRRNGRLFFQASNVLPEIFGSTPVVIVNASKGRLTFVPLPHANQNAALCGDLKSEVEKAVFIPQKPALESLTIDPGWERRSAMLAGNDNVRTTSAGDQCYTARFIIDAVLRAAGRDEFDIDACSMQDDGRYDKAVKKITRRSWGSTPMQFRKDECVVGHVPAKMYLTNDRPYGSLVCTLEGEFIWINPPYSLRAWVTFLEYANLQVEKGNAGIVVVLVPCDNTGPHNRHFYGEHAYRIEITRQIPFFKREKRNKEGKVIARNIIDTIKGNQFVVFGKGPKVKTFLRRFLKELRAMDYISEQHESRYRMMFELNTNRRSQKMAA